MSRYASLVLALACAATLVACGGSSPSSSASGSSASSGSSSTPGSSGAAGGGGGRNSAAFAKFRDCLKAQGVDVPARPGGGANGGAPPQQSPAQQKAMQACAKYRPQGPGPGGPGGGAGGQNAAAFTPYLTCLKDQGLNVDVNAGFNALRGIKRDDPKLQPALKACSSKLPQRPQRAPGASSTTPGSTT